jgi:cysteine desulfurase
VARVYLDWNATAPPLPAVLDAMRDAARDQWANPSSVHTEGRAARASVEEARAAVAALAACDVRDVLLTSGGTEANNLAIRSFFEDAPGTLLTSRLEHPSVTRVAEVLARRAASATEAGAAGAHVSWVPARDDGRIDLDALSRALAACGEARVLIALQAVNHETGVIQPVDDVIALARARTHAETRVHVDAVQAWGRIEPLGAAADSRSLAAHKIRGPKGIGALVTREGVTIRPVLVGGAQERGIRPGTIDPIAAAGLAVAAAHARSSPARYAALAPLRDALERALLAASPGARVNGTAPRAPHVTNVSFPAWNGAELVAALDLEGIAVSSGSACSAGTIEPSPVVTAMFDDARARGALRVSLGEETSRDDMTRATAAFANVLARAT